MTNRQDTVVESKLMGQWAGVIRRKPTMGNTPHIVLVTEHDEHDLIKLLEACAGSWPIHITIERFTVSLKPKEDQGD